MKRRRRIMRLNRGKSITKENEEAKLNQDK